MLGYLGLYPERFAESIVVAREVNIQFPITIFKHNELSVCRYGCDGKPQANRTYAYFEYPSYVTMLLCCTYSHCAIIPRSAGIAWG